MNALYASLFLLAVTIPLTAKAQSPDQSPVSQLEALTRKIDEQNIKIDALSQQILKLELQLAKPGVMIGETSPAPAASAISTIDPARASGPSHVVARGETLTSIAKMYKVGVEELQKFNHIENDRKLQIGQVILLPPSGATAAPSATPTASIRPNG